MIVRKLLLCEFAGVNKMYTYSNTTSIQYELGQPKSGKGFLKLSLVNHRKLGVKSWQH